MRSAERGSKIRGFSCSERPNRLFQGQRGGWNMGFGLGLPQPYSSICLIPLWLDALKRPSCVPGPHVGLGRERPPQKQGGHAVPHRWQVEHASVPAPMGSLTSLFIPAGRLGKPPLSPRASSCRIGPRRQGFASPLRALDGSGPIRKTRCLRGERGGSGRGARGRSSA